MVSLHINSDAQIRSAICAHVDWRRKLSNGIQAGRCEQSSEEIACCESCNFGQWLKDLGSILTDPDDPAMQKYEVIRKLHKRFHEEAGQIAKALEEGKAHSAVELFEREYYRRLTNSLVLMLDDWRYDFEKVMH